MKFDIFQLINAIGYILGIISLLSEIGGNMLIKSALIPISAEKSVTVKLYL